MNPLNYVYVLVATLVIGYIWILKTDISELKERLKDTKLELDQAKTNSAICKSVIDSSNKQIESMSIDLKSRNRELKKWKSQKPKVKYKIIYKNIVKDTNLTGECEDVKTIINSVSDINLNSL